MTARFDYDRLIADMERDEKLRRLGAAIFFSLYFGALALGAWLLFQR